jgi:hypothetical protein
MTVKADGSYIYRSALKGNQIFIRSSESSGMYCSVLIECRPIDHRPDNGGSTHL